MPKKKRGKAILKSLPKEESTGTGSTIRQVILGGQDGLVNVLGIILGVASATSNIALVLISGVAATLAESISMAAVAYTSSKAAKEFYDNMEKKERQEMKEVPETEQAEIRYIYYHKGFRGKFLERIVRRITSNDKVWLEDMMLQELRMTETQFGSPLREATVVGISSLVGSILPLIPFVLLPIKAAIIASVVFSAIILFAVGAVKSRFTMVKWWRSGAEIAGIGIAAAIIGYVVGMVLGATIKV
ncbi:MAG: VIT1/CCC1 transporter family protein [archaeon]